MKDRFITLSIGLLLLACPLFAQTNAHQSHYCGDNAFNTEVINAETGEDGCTRYTLEVSYDEGCKYALSHYTIAASCGRITSVSNSEGWKQETGYDKTTKLYGAKIDDIPDFGNTSLKTFTVTFSLCPSDKYGDGKCSDSTRCCYPVVAYKAAKCVYYDKLEGYCPSPDPDPEPGDLVASIEKEDATCGGQGGSLAVTVEGGVEPYMYYWSTGDTTASIANLSPGTYEVVVEDAAGAEVLLRETIEQPGQPAIAGSVLHETCSGKSNGSVDLTVQDGTAPYTYAWSNGATTEDISGLTAGVYEVTVTDASGCIATTSFNIQSIVQINITATTSLPACNQTDGSIDITVVGGSVPYTYAWSNGATTEDIQNIGPGTYKVTVTDAEGCSAEVMYAIKENNTLKLTTAITQTTCLDDGSGAIDLTVQGGTAPYTYAWSNGATTEDITGLTAGIYTVTVTDANGCTMQQRVSVTKKTFQVSSQVTQPSCDGTQGGSVTLMPIGGASPYTYVWSTGATTAGVSDLDPGIYTVTITDDTGCSRDLVYVISEPTAITASASVSNDQCNAEGAFSIDLTVSGGTPPYSYSWSNGATTEDIGSLNSGTYTVTITDAAGCSVTQEVVIQAGAEGWSCLIDHPDSTAVCASAGNMLGTSVTGADSYTWTVESSDGQWAITAGSSDPAITYTAGGTGSSATFTLTIVKDGCTQTCEYTATSCTDIDDPGDDDGGDDDGSDDGDDGDDDDGNDDGDDDDDGGDDGNDDGDDDDNDDGSCEDCFDSDIVKTDKDGSCRTYTVTVSTDGSCRHDLSHWTVAIPCGYVKHYSNAENWKMEYGKDPTTGLYGLKVEGIENFGNESGHFTVTFTICYDDYACKDELNSWSPVVAYKAGQCVAYDSLELEYGDDNDHAGDGGCTAYPNPFKDDLTFEWTAEHDEEVSLDVYDAQGHYVKKLYKGKVSKGQQYKVSCQGLSGSLYFYRFSSGSRTTHGKLCKSQ